MQEDLLHQRNLHVRNFGITDYSDTFKAMRQFTDSRNETTPDEFWLLQHYPVFTQGQAGKSEHLLKKSDIPVVQSDRGGQITYHGPGQIVLYTLVDMKRQGIDIRKLVTELEQAVINLLLEYQINAERRCGAPGVYILGAKIASIGLRVRRGFCYHGLCFNVDMDLNPYHNIRPCGLDQLKIIQLRDIIGKTKISIVDLQHKLCHHLAKLLGYNKLTFY